MTTTKTAKSKRCTCDPRKMASRGRCAIHGFEADPTTRLRKQIEKMPIRKLIEEVLNLADGGVDALDGDENPIYDDDERQRLHLLVHIAHKRLVNKRGKRAR
jgi:hypothetical protein